MILASWLWAVVWAAETDPSALADETFEEPLGPDRSAPPPVPLPVIKEFAEPERRTIHGMEVWLMRVPGARRVKIAALAARGVHDMPKPPSSWRAMAWMADAATEANDPEALSQIEGVFDVTVRSEMVDHHGEIVVDAPRDELDRALALWRDALREPVFPKVVLKRYVLNQQLFYQVQGPSDPASVAALLMANTWFPADHPYGERPDLELLERLKVSSMPDQQREWLAESPVTVWVVGDVGWADVEGALTEALDGIGTPGPRAQELPFDGPTGTHVRAAHLEGQEQVVITLRLHAPPDGGDAAATTMANFILGGHFLSRLNANLREEKGWTYGAGARYRRTRHFGTETIKVDVKAENLAATVREIEVELARLVSDGVTEDELDMARRSFLSNHNQQMLNADSAFGLALGAWLDEESMADQVADVNGLLAVTPDDVKAVAAAHWGEGAARVWVFVGDRAAMEPQLADLGLATTWVEARDAIVGKVPAAQ
jgi:zinc protease